jgi:Rieske Fe-S protein
MKGRALVAGTAAFLFIAGAALVLGVATNGEELPHVALSDLREHGVLHLEEHQVFVVHHDGEFLALSDDAQHIGDRVHFCESSKLFQSPAHGEKFDILGRYLGGPARRGLDRYGTREDGDRLYVLLNDRQAGPPRGEPVLSPEGPFCDH